MYRNARLQGFLDAGLPGSKLYVSYAGHAQYAQLCAGFGVCNIAGDIVCGANYSVTARQVQVLLPRPNHMRPCCQSSFLLRWPCSSKRFDLHWYLKRYADLKNVSLRT